MSTRRCRGSKVSHANFAAGERWKSAGGSPIPISGAHACNLEYLAAGSNAWQPVPLASATESILGTWDGLATLDVPAGTQPITVRASLTDLAGNRALYQSSVTHAAGDESLAGNGPQLFGGQDVLSPAANLGTELGWVASSAPSPTTNSQVEPAEPQLWPADQSLRPENSITNNTTATISYGVPLGIAEPVPPTTESATDENLVAP